MLDPDQAPGFLLEWDRLLSDVGRAEVLILNFAQVEYVTASFLKCLITIYRELARKDAMLVVCQLQEQVREVFCVAGSRQPLADFNYVETEEQALMKARRFRRAQDDGEKLAGNAC
jgi:anti-anti-sigma regulatory factor